MAIFKYRNKSMLGNSRGKLYSSEQKEHFWFFKVFSFQFLVRIFPRSNGRSKQLHEGISFSNNHNWQRHENVIEDKLVTNVV